MASKCVPFREREGVWRKAYALTNLFVYLRKRPANTQTLKKLCCLRLLLRMTIKFAAYHLRDSKIAYFKSNIVSTLVFHTETLVSFQQLMNAISAYLGLTITF